MSPSHAVARIANQASIKPVSLLSLSYITNLSQFKNKPVISEGKGITWPINQFGQNGRIVDEH